MKIFLKIFFGLVFASLLLLIADSLLQPKVRVVPLEGVPQVSGAPDVTFMIGAYMEPPVQTNPFLVIFSPLERMTARTRVVPGSFNNVSDSTTAFVWEAFGIQTTWHVDRISHRLTPVIHPSAGDTPHLCTRLFPTVASALHSKRDRK